MSAQLTKSWENFEEVWALPATVLTKSATMRSFRSPTGVHDRWSSGRSFAEAGSKCSCQPSAPLPRADEGNIWLSNIKIPRRSLEFRDVRRSLMWMTKGDTRSSISLALGPALISSGVTLSRARLKFLDIMPATAPRTMHRAISPSLTTKRAADFGSHCR